MFGCPHTRLGKPGRARHDAAEPGGLPEKIQNILDMLL
jgi:hypothetical protein